MTDPAPSGGHRMVSGGRSSSPAWLIPIGMAAGAVLIILLLVFAQ